ncbi:MAG TPA: endonuclease/exonuclease/phosphatase family protein [Anaerolineae bacterium]
MSLRILTYNILDGGIGREGFILEVLQAVQPDVVILQEVFHLATVEQFATALDMAFFFARGNSKRHLALLSRLPIVTSHTYRPFPPIHNCILEATLEVAPEQQLYVFGVHLIAHPFVVFELWRQWEVRTVLQRAKRYRSSPCLIAGDFNAIAPNDPVIVKLWPRFLKLMLALQGGRIFRKVIREVLSAGFTDCYRQLHSEKNGFTLPTPDPNVRLDYIFVNDVLIEHLRKCHVVREPATVDRASDHYPVMAEFKNASYDVTVLLSA